MCNILKNKILLTLPYMKKQGGVSSFYNGLLGHFPNDLILKLEIGRNQNDSGFLHPFIDQFRFRTAVKYFKPTLIHLNPSLGLKSFIRDGCFAWQAKQMGHQVLVFWHGWDKNFEAIVEKKLMWFFRNTFGQVDCFIVLASEFEKKLREWGINTHIFRETTNVEDSLLQGFDLNKKLNNLKNNIKRRILFLGRIERAKGVFETVDAINILHERGVRVSLSIAGDGSAFNQLVKYVKNLDLPEGTIHFMGHIKNQEKKKAFINHDIYCLPSYSEGLPISMLEAMAFGMPVVTRPVGGIVDMFENNKMGMLVQSKNPEEIAQALLKIIIDKKLITKIAHYNATYAKDHLMASVAAERLATIYRATIATVNL